LHFALTHIDKSQLNMVAELLMEAYRKETQIFVFGNGGSALTASHLACDLNKGASEGLETRWKVIALTDNIGTISAYANDVSYDDIFVEQLKNFLKVQDLVIGISGSGNSTNVVRAVEYANRLGATTVGLTGYDGGHLARAAMFTFNANINDMQVSEDLHMVAVHLLMQVLKTCCSTATKSADQQESSQGLLSAVSTVS
jgi:D-sedoheptulose 7-phosphate isomerase